MSYLSKFGKVCFETFALKNEAIVYVMIFLSQKESNTSSNTLETFLKNFN